MKKDFHDFIQFKLGQINKCMEIESKIETPLRSKTTHQSFKNILICLLTIID